MAGGGFGLQLASPHLTIVPHTHWDREWYRTHEQFRFRLVRLIDGLLDLLESDPAFRHFTLDGQAVVVDDYLEVRPRARERIAKLVEAGRLHVGPWYVLPDEWLVSGEALIRNLRLGLRRAHALGGVMRLGYVPDQFGHVGQLPQIFAGFGFDAALLWRGVGADVRETLFNWESPDGSQLLSVFLSRSYSNASYLPADPEALAERLREEIERLGKRSRIGSLLLMNGTDHAEPDPGLPLALEAAAARLPGVELEIGSLPGFLKRVQAERPVELPLHRGEFRSGLRSPLLSGCASARMPQKRADFENDRLLTRYLEPLAAWLGTLGAGVDSALIDFAWRIALENHPHDSICGCSIDAVHEQMETRFARVRELAGAQLEQVFGELARRVEIPAGCFANGDGPRFAVWNPNPAGASPVEAEIELDGDLSSERRHIRTLDGTRLATQVERLEQSTDLRHFSLPPAFAQSFLAREAPELLGYWLQDLSWQEGEGGGLTIRLHLGSNQASAQASQQNLSEKRQRLRRVLSDCAAETVTLSVRRRSRVRVRFVDPLPAYGLRVYQLARGRASGHRELVAARTPEGGCTIENTHWRVEVDRRGRVALIRRVDGVRVDDALRLVSEADRGDEYSFDPLPDAGWVERPERVRVGLEGSAASGPTLAIRLRARYRLPASLTSERSGRSAGRVWLPVDLRIRLWAGLDRIDLSLELENRARDHRLRLFARAPFEASRFQVESAFEIAEREIVPPLAHELDRRPAELPVGATPQRSFASIDDGRCALSLANRGLAEVEAVPQGDGSTCLAITILRAVGWLSRDDLVMRPGHAGPPIETPAAQVPGTHRAELSLRWHAVGDPMRVAEAHRFARGPIAVQLADASPGEASTDRSDLQSSGESRAVGAHDPLSDGSQLFELDDPEVVVSAVEARPDGEVLLRLYNSSGTSRRVAISWKGPGPVTFEPVDLAERFDHRVQIESELGVANLALRAWQIVSLRVRR